MRHIWRVLDEISGPQSDFHIYTRCWKSMDCGQNMLLYQFSNYLQNEQKTRFLMIFSNFLQALRYCLGYQNNYWLNGTYLKDFGWDLRPRKWFSHLYSMLRISGLWPKYAFTPIFQLPSKMSKKRVFWNKTFKSDNY